MKKLFLSACILFAAFAASFCQSSCLQVDIMLVGDYSGSVDGHQEYVANAMWAFVDRFGLSEASVKIGIITFNSEVTLHTGLTTNKAKLQNIIVGLSTTVPSGTTNLKDALYESVNQLQYGRKVPKLLVIISDGVPDDREETAQLAGEVQKLIGATVCGIYVSAPGGEPGWLKNICSDGCYSETSYETLAEELKKLDICM